MSIYSVFHSGPTVTERVLHLLSVVLSTIRALPTATNLNLCRCSGCLTEFFRMLEPGADTLTLLQLA